MSEQTKIVWESDAEVAHVAEAFIAQGSLPNGDLKPPVEPAPAPKEVPTVALSQVPEPSAGDVPGWALWPAGLAVPRGRVAYFVRFASNWTDAPGMGVEQALTPEDDVAWKLAGVTPPQRWRLAIFWSLSIGDQKIALGRANGDGNRFNTELAKQMVRSIDGVIVNRDGTGSAASGNLDLWWEQLGERCRAELTRMCVRVSTLTMQERALFLGRCVAARTAG